MPPGPTEDLHNIRLSGSAAQRSPTLSSSIKGLVVDSDAAHGAPGRGGWRTCLTLTIGYRLIYEEVFWITHSGCDPQGLDTHRQCCGFRYKFKDNFLEISPGAGLVVLNCAGNFSCKDREFVEVILSFYCILRKP